MARVAALEKMSYRQILRKKYSTWRAPEMGRTDMFVACFVFSILNYAWTKICTCLVLPCLVKKFLSEKKLK